MTAGPSVGPASAYPTFRRPASICFRESKDVFVPGLLVVTSAGFVSLDCAYAQPIMPSWVAAIVMAATPRKQRLLRVMSSNMGLSPIGEIAIPAIPVALPARSFLADRSVIYPAHLP